MAQVFLRIPSLASRGCLRQCQADRPADIYAVIAYYLRHRNEVRAYLKRREEETEALRAKIEAECPRVSREELLARRSARDMPEEEIRDQCVVFLPFRR